jgi:hypothetical protein
MSGSSPAGDPPEDFGLMDVSSVRAAMFIVHRLQTHGLL